jgi:cytoskeleton protein RodZ
MAKREPDIEVAEEELVEAPRSPVGEQLRVAREGKGLSLEDVAAQTRIPLRHLASIETGDWENLPAPTYTIGFAKNYAGVVGLDRNEIGTQLREEMGGQRFASTSNDVFEAADPARTMPKSLVIGAILAVVVLIALMSWLNRRSLDQTEPPPAAETNTAAPAPQSPAPAPQAAPAAAQGQVVLTAITPVWLQVGEKGGATLFSGVLQPGQTYAVPATATAPVLKTGKPEALKINVGNQVAPPVGPPATTVANVSLLPADLMKSPAAAGPAPAAAAQPQQPRGFAPQRRARARSAVPTPPPPAAAPETPPTTNSQ